MAKESHVGFSMTLHVHLSSMILQLISTLHVIQKPW